MSLSETEIPRVYIFSGDDTVGKDTQRARSISEIRRVHPKAIIERYDPSAQSFTDFSDHIFTPTLFSDVRLFIINRAEALSVEELAALDTIIATVPDDAYILIDIGKASGRKKKGADASGMLHLLKRSRDTSGRFSCMVFEKPPEYKTVQWLVEMSSNLCGRPIARPEAELLVDLAGYDTAVLYSELQKISLYGDEGAAINADTIHSIVGSSRPMSIFEFASACISKNGTRALQIVDSLFATPFSVPMLISVLYRQYGALLRLREYARVAPQDIKLLLKSGGGFQAKNEAAFRAGRAAGLLGEGEERKVYPVIIASGIVGDAQRYTERELKYVLTLVMEFDEAIKTGKIAGSRREIELLCYRLIRVSCFAGDGVA